MNRLKHLLLKAVAFCLVQLSLPHTGATQDFERLPNLNGNLISWSNSIAENKSVPLFQGTFFYKTVEEMVSPDQNPFFEESWDRNGAITYEGRLYNGIGLIYNASEDLLLLWLEDIRKGGTKSLLINQQKVDSFVVHNQKFLNYRHIEIGSKGFYKRVMQGTNLTCYSKYSKKGNLEELEYVYEEKSQYWIKYKGEFYEYKNYSTLHKLFPEHKKQIRKYLNENRVIARKDRERFLQLMLYHCDSLL